MTSNVKKFAVISILLFISESGSADHECGVQNFQDKIINGMVTGIDEYPWTVLIGYKQRNTNKEFWGCGGSLVGVKTVITAAHCVDDSAIESLGEIGYVRLGEYNYSSEMDCVELNNFKDCTDPPIDIKVTNIIIHPERNVNTKLHDIAILILEKEPPYTDFIRPICLPDQTVTDPSRRKGVLYVAGWGWTIGTVISPSNVKRDSPVNAVSTKECRKYYPNINENFQLCAGGEDGHSACKGDSGGPLMYSETDKWTLEGVVSYGLRTCGRVGYDGAPAVFTRISAHLPWIKSVLIDQ